MNRISHNRSSMLAILVGLGISLSLAVSASALAQSGKETQTAEKKEQKPLVEIKANPFPSTYEPLASEPILITNVHLLDGIGGHFGNGSILLADGKIVAVGEDLEAPPGIKIIDGGGRWVTAGIIDTHSHLGVYPSPQVRAHADGNEVSSPNTAEVWAEHAILPQDPGFARASAGGITVMQILPGSANLFGGRGVTVKNVPSRTMQGMKFPGAPQGLKMACGENPKRVYGLLKKAPSSRMGNMAGYRKAWATAVEYKRDWDNYRADHAAGKDPKVPKRNLQMDTLVGVLEGEILVHNHCYRADEMVNMIDLSKEFGYHISSFHHAVEAYKIADYLAANDICASMWADWWGFKAEAYDGIRENIPFVHDAGACAIVHSDSAIGIQRLHQEAAKALADARKAGLKISIADAWRWLSYNPAKALGIADQTGSLEPGKDADLVVWSGNPFSVYTKAEQVYVDGALIFDLNDETHQPVSDFRLGQPGEGDVK